MNKFVVIVTLLTGIIIYGCSNGGSSIEINSRPWLHSKEFSQNTNLHAQFGQTIILGLDDSLLQNNSGSANKTTHVISYHLPEDNHFNFRLQTEDPCITSVKAYDAVGKEAFSIDLNKPAVKTFLKAGQYKIHIQEAVPLPKDCSSSFIYKVSNPSANKNRLKDSNVVYYDSSIWRSFLIYDDDYDMNLLMAADSFKTNTLVSTNMIAALMSYAYSSVPLAYNNPRLLFQLIQRWQQYFLMSVTDPLNRLVPLSSYLIPPKNCGQSSDNSYLCLMDYNNSKYNNILAFGNPKDIPQDQKHSASQLDLLFSCDSTHQCSMTLTDNYFTKLFAGCPSAARTDTDCLKFLYGHYTTTGAQPYTFNFLEAYRYYTDVSKLNGQGYSINPLPTGEVAVYSGKNYTGTALVFNADADLTDIPLDFSGFPVNSIRFADDTSTMYLRDGTKLGVDLPDASFYGIVIKGPRVFKAIDIVFSRDCPGCNLQDADLSNHTMDKRDFTGANFTRANLSRSSFISTVFKGAIMQSANLNNANLKGANLCKAMLNKDSDYQQSATLNGAYLQNANLAYAELSGTTFVNANFHSMTSRQGCIPDDNCNTSNCASAYKATMANADFTGAYLAGLDMSNAVLTSAKFTNAFVVGANFTGAQLNNDVNTGQSGAVFIGSFLYGANFQNANVKGVQFINSYFDDQVVLPQTNAMAIVYLNMYYTSFTGSPFMNSYVCPQYAAPRITNGDSLPLTDQTVTCPNGQFGPCSGVQWKASLPIDNTRIAVTYGGSYPYPAPSTCEATHVYMFW